MERKIPYFKFYYSWATYFDKLSTKEVADVIRKLLEPEGDIELTLAAEMVYMMIKDQNERNEAAYEEKCEKNRENGAKGGRPPKGSKEEERRGVYPGVRADVADLSTEGGQGPGIQEVDRKDQRRVRPERADPSGGRIRCSLQTVQDGAQVHQACGDLLRRRRTVP